MLFQFCIHYLDCGCLLLVVTPEVLKQRVNGGRVDTGRVGAGRVDPKRVEDELQTQFLGQHTIVPALR